MSKSKKQNAFEWLIEPLVEAPSYFEKPMFGCIACYLHGRLTLVLATKEEPWNGLLIPTEKEFHESIKAEFNDLVQHPILKKWLYLSQAAESFESAGAEIIEAIRTNDLRFGVEPKEKRSKIQP